MTKKLQTPCAAPKRGIPWELKYDFAMKGYTNLGKGYLFAIREKYGAAAALEIYEMVNKMGDRAKNFTNTIRTIFNLEGNDAETIGQFFDIWAELTDQEVIILERSKTVNRIKYIKCPWSTPFPKDISNWNLIWRNLITKTINPKAILERPKAMCAGDPFCEYVWRIED
jgi:hypothetical protein